MLLYRKEIILEKQNCKLFVVLFVENNSITVVDDCRLVYIGVDILSVEVKKLISFGRLAFTQITAVWLLKDTVLHLKQEVVQYFVNTFNITVTFNSYAFIYSFCYAFFFIYQLGLKSPNLQLITRKWKDRLLYSVAWWLDTLHLRLLGQRMASN